MSERLTPQEIEQLRIWHMADSPARLHSVAQRRIVCDMLRLYDEQERLRNLQAEDVTQDQESHVYHEWCRISRGGIAAAVRVVVASLDNPADTA